MEMRDRLADLAPAIRIAGAGAATRATFGRCTRRGGSRERPSRGADVGRSPDSFERLHCWCCRRERVAGYWQRAHRQPNASVPQRTNGARPGSAKGYSSAQASPGSADPAFEGSSPPDFHYLSLRQTAVCHRRRPGRKRRGSCWPKGSYGDRPRTVRLREPSGLQIRLGLGGRLRGVNRRY